jgi:tRNA pseudouridine55 synthase
VKTLHRSGAGLFDETQCISFEQLEEEHQEANVMGGTMGSYAALDAHLLSADAPVATLPAIHLPEPSAYYFRLGNPVMDAQAYRIAAQGDMVRVFCAESEQAQAQFLGLGEITDDGLVAPKRIIANRSANEQ